jgi:hypothetical protein
MKVFSISLEQYRQGAVWERSNYDVQASTMEQAIKKARSLAVKEGTYLKSYPIEVKDASLLTRDLR